MHTAYVMACTILPALGQAAFTAELSVTVLDNAGRPFAGAAVIAEPQTPAPRPNASPRSEMDQRDLQFVPNLLVIRTGTAVSFPNSDQVWHQVYSFSGARTFQLSLYAGRAHPPVIFDKPGLVTLGCNIHDGMIGYIYVTDSPWHGRSDTNGQLTLQNLPAGNYTVKIWHQRFNDPAASLSRSVTLTDDQAVRSAFLLKQNLKPALHSHGNEKQWEDY